VHWQRYTLQSCPNLQRQIWETSGHGSVKDPLEGSAAERIEQIAHSPKLALSATDESAIDRKQIEHWQIDRKEAERMMS